MDIVLGRFKIAQARKESSITLPQSIFDHGVDSVLTPKGKLKQKTSFFGKMDDGQQSRTALTLYEDDLRENRFGEMLHKDDNSKKKANLGTFLGVFLPCCQNIVGVIFFVRFPWIVGCAGMIEGLIIVGLCCLVSITVAISISAIATNGKVTAGGTYFMISRSLGPAFGGSVGILFFMGTSISVAMYYIGTVETLLNYIAPEMTIFGGDALSVNRQNDYRVYGTALLLFMTVICFIGVTCVQWFGLFAILFLVAAIFSVLIGIAVANEEGSVKACMMGGRVFRYDFVNYNNSWYCNKDIDGPIYKAYCINGTCDDYFLKNEAKLIPAIPGLRLRILKDNLMNRYTELDKIPNTDIDAVSGRDIVTDLTSSFVILMAIYFPSITGVESGSNYSGDLKDPHRSIPAGTMVAVSVTSTLYIDMTAVVLFSGSVEGSVLTDKYGYSISDKGELMLSLMAWPTKWVVLIGTLTATVGAGLQALAGGPRLLLAISCDDIFPFLSCFAYTWNGEPTRCLCVTFMIAFSGILISRLDYVAPIVTMFFLMCYGFINFAVTLQSLLDLPHWRPSFKCFHWIVTLLGSSLCICIMFASNYIYATVAILILFCLYQYIEYKGAEKEWGDGITGLNMSAAIYALKRLKSDYCHTKNWRPQFMVMLKPTTEETNEFNGDNLALIHLAQMLQMGKGLTLYTSVIHGRLDDHAEDVNIYKKVFREKLEDIGAKGFVDLVISPNISCALSCMIQCGGIGPLHPNTVIMGWPKDWVKGRKRFAHDIFLETMRNVALCNNATIVLKSEDFPKPMDRIQGTIDIWWIVNDGGMLLLLAHLLKRTKTWSHCRVRVFSVAEARDNTLQIEKDLKQHLYELRMDCQVEVVEMKTSDMSAYVYERTMKLEERTRMLAFIDKNKRSKDSQAVLERARSVVDVKRSGDALATRYYEESGGQFIAPNSMNVRHMNTAVTLNRVITSKSSEASLIILNLPCVPEQATAQANYMSFLEVLTEGLSNNILLVRGTGSEVITIFN